MGGGLGYNRIGSEATEIKRWIRVNDTSETNISTFHSIAVQAKN
jgi:hypothetical protein